MIVLAPFLSQESRKTKWCFCIGVTVWIRRALPAITSYWALICSSTRLWCSWAGFLLNETKLQDVYIKPWSCKWTLSTWDQTRLSTRKLHVLRCMYYGCQILSNKCFAPQSCSYWFALSAVKAGYTTPIELKWEQKKQTTVYELCLCSFWWRGGEK